MEPSHPHHDTVLAQAVAAHHTISIARTPDARHTAAAVAAALGEALRRIDRLRFATEPGLHCTYVTDTWTGQTVDLHYDAHGAEQIAARRNTANIRDGRDELSRRIAEHTDLVAAWQDVAGPLVPEQGVRA